jgi:hypothetical protein
MGEVLDASELHIILGSDLPPRNDTSPGSWWIPGPDCQLGASRKFIAWLAFVNRFTYIDARGEAVC